MSGGQERVGGGGTDGGGAFGPGRAGEPAGDVYDWFRRGGRLLAEGNPAAAEQLLARAAAAEPQSHSIREALARAQFDTGSYAAALENFKLVAQADPSDDYAQFGWGVSAARLGDFEASAKHLALAVAMRPEAEHYRAALRQTRATLAARAGAFGPLLPGAPGYLAPPRQSEEEPERGDGPQGGTSTSTSTGTDNGVTAGADGGTGGAGNGVAGGADDEVDDGKKQE
ncbi:tetratricopeptide repeat protein [Kitasatospora sp. NPDC050543]|uniref:tetratricopeptide repeat protein n=1 Tax=Kitasatospora sp. NPDC050543 TaxID=3364054 RepID=UPI0037983F52